MNKGRTLQQYRETCTTGGCGLQDASCFKLGKTHLPVLQSWPVSRDKAGKAELGIELGNGHIIQLPNSGSIMLSAESAKTGLGCDNQLSQTAMKEEQSLWTVCTYHQWSVPTTSGVYPPPATPGHLEASGTPLDMTRSSRCWIYLAYSSECWL